MKKDGTRDLRVERSSLFSVASPATSTMVRSKPRLPLRSTVTQYQESVSMFVVHIITGEHWGYLWMFVSCREVILPFT